MSRARTFADLATTYGQGNALGKRNIAFNGDMAVSQRATSTSAVGATSSHYPTLDRYLYQANTSGRATVSQAAITDLAGFRFAQKIDVTTADTSIAAGEYFIINQMIEGFDVQRLQYGTSDAKRVTVSFYVKGTAKTYACEILTSANGTSKTFNVTTSWNRVSLTFPANTGDTVNQDNTNEFQLSIWLHAGSTYTGGTMSGAWGSTAANRAAGIGSIFSSTDNELFITGLQIETGDVATPFEYESFEQNLVRCQRYFRQIGTIRHQGANGDPCGQIIPLEPTMRVEPTVAGTNSTGGSHSIAGTGDFPNTQLIYSGTAATSGGSAFIQFTGVTADAEL